MPAESGEASSTAPRVSVVVPFFDSAATIDACAEALLAQEDVGGGYEVLFVDNGSRDGSRGRVERYRAVTVLEERTPGAYAARNAGARAARAPVVAFTDSDCAVDRRWLHAILEGLRDPAVGALVGQVRYPTGASRALRLLGAYENAKTEYVLRRCPPAQRFAYTNNMAVRAELLAELGPFCEWPRAADSELMHRMAARRPDLRLEFCAAMRVTHLEFTRLRARARRLALYTRTNARIETFRELGAARRLGVLLHLLRGGGGWRG